MYTLTKNNNRLLLSSSSLSHRAIHMDLVNNTHYLIPGQFELDLETGNFPERLRNEYIALDKFAKSIDALVYLIPRKEGHFIIKKTANKTLYGGYKGNIFPRIKFTRTPEGNIETLLKRFNIELHSFKEMPIECYTDKFEYYTETVIKNSSVYYLINQINSFFKSSNIDVTYTTCGKYILHIHSTIKSFELIVSNKPYQSKVKK